MIRSILVVSLFLITSCATPQAEMDKNNRNLLLLDIGMSKAEVMSIMGEPRLNEAYESINGEPVVIWFYYTQRKIADYNYTKDEMTPLIFRSGRLVGWGDEFYESKEIIEIRNR